MGWWRYSQSFIFRWKHNNDSSIGLANGYDPAASLCSLAVAL